MSTKAPGLTVPLTLLGRANEVSQILARRVNRVLALTRACEVGRAMPTDLLGAWAVQRVLAARW